MINLTSRIQCAGKEPPIRVVTNVVNQVCAITNAHANELAISNRRSSPYAFSKLFSAEARRGAHVLDLEFLNESLELTCANQMHRKFNALEQYTASHKPSGDEMPYVIRGLRLVLLRLWDLGAIVLPTRFLPREAGHAFSWDTLGAIPCTLGYGKAQYVFHLLRATDWKSCEDVSIVEAAAFLRAQNLARTEANAEQITASPIPVREFLADVLRLQPDRARYNEYDLNCLSLWAMTHQQKLTFPEFCESTLPLRSSSRESASSPQHTHTLARKPRQPKPDTPQQQAEHLEKLLSSTSKTPADLHAGVLSYFGQVDTLRLKVEQNLDGTWTFSARPHATIPNSAFQSWKISWDRFMAHRQLKGIQTLTAEQAARSMIFKYIFCYLYWWKEIFPNGMTNIPTHPNEFTTFPFVSNLHLHSFDGNSAFEVEIQNFPLPIRDFIHLLRPSNSATNTILRILRLYFQFVIDYLDDERKITDRPFTNPITTDINFPESKPTRTTKVTVPINVEGHFKAFLYAAEAFGDFLLSSSLDESLNEYSASRARFPQPDMWDTSLAGYVPIYWYRGSFHPVKFVPSAYFFSNREVSSQNFSISKLLIPHLTTLRLCLVGTESGLRFQHVQWLDINTWDQGNSREDFDYRFHYVPPAEWIYDISINTDKQRTKAWESLIVYRVRSVLLREEFFQKHICQDASKIPVLYEGRKNTPFAPVTVLFQSHSGSGKPVSDETYQDCWVELMFGFQTHYRGLYPTTEIRFVHIKPPVSPGRANKGTTDEGAEYCHLNYRAISTPHSSRATFVTNRGHQLEVDDLGEIVGHQNENSVTYYNRPHRNDTAARFASADAVVFADFLPLDKDVLIRADKPDSALVTAFKADRDATIKDFRFASSFVLWNLEELRSLADGADTLLREAPMAQIAFHETHICPVGDDCPEEVISALGDIKRCGGCPLAMKCVDHIPAIQAKTNTLRARIRFAVKKEKEMKKSGEPEIAIDAVWEARNVDMTELLGWMHSLKILDQELQQTLDGQKSEKIYFTNEPEIVKLKLERFSVDANLGLQLATRIIEAEAYRCRRRVVCSVNGSS